MFQQSFSMAPQYFNYVVSYVIAYECVTVVWHFSKVIRNAYEKCLKFSKNLCANFLKEEKQN